MLLLRVCSPKTKRWVSIMVMLILLATPALSPKAFCVREPSTDSGALPKNGREMPLSLVTVSRKDN